MPALLRPGLERGAALAVVTAALLFGPSALAQQQAAPPAVGVVDVVKRPITETSEFLGRIEAVNRVNVVARVTAFLDKRLYEEGAEVKTGAPLYRLERGPFEADLAAKKAQVAQLQATLTNAQLTTERQKTLLSGPAGQQSNYDAAIANQKSLEAQVQAAQAQVQLSQINLDYTDIRSPIDGRIGRTAVTEGNVVSPSSGTLTTIVSQDPMYVTFPIPVREVLSLRERYATKGGYSAVVIRLKLPDGRIYQQVGHLNFASNSITQTTDTLLVRGTIPNPPLYPDAKGNQTVRELFDGEFVTVLLEGVEPVQVLAVPRSAVLSDQQGDYVMVVGPDNKVVQRRIHLGQSTATIASVTDGLALGDKVIAEGLQRVRPGQVVKPGPAGSEIQSIMKQAQQAGAISPAAAPAGGAKTEGTK
ncbi:MAG TPA: efflux RND transporter periplasmic adaptor subunit [Nitrobacter sp.]|nr:efflux RND transporter periplasmic adaptor subunit [Nitrobacter sp.]